MLVMYKTHILNVIYSAGAFLPLYILCLSGSSSAGYLFVVLLDSSVWSANCPY